jgi:hypothetical protein
VGRTRDDEELTWEGRRWSLFLVVRQSKTTVTTSRSRDVDLFATKNERAT